SRSSAASGAATPSNTMVATSPSTGLASSTPPEHDIPVIVSAFGPEAAELAGRIGDGFWGTAPDSELLERFEGAGGTGPRYAQITVCWNEDELRARQTAHRRWPNAGLSGAAGQELPTWTHFEDAVSTIGADAVTATIPCGP